MHQRIRFNKIKLNFHKNLFFYIFIILLGVIVFETGVLAKPSLKDRLNKTNRLQQYANEVVDKCSSKNWHPSCYDKEIPKLLNAISLEEAFQVTKLVQEKDSSYWYCHVLGHNISAKETAKDPSKWKEVITRCPSGVCSNGCIHGAFQERFRKEELTEAEIDKLMPDLENICEEKPSWHPTGLEQATCYHALGHLMMYISGADIKKSNAICELTAKKSDGRNFLQTCYEGNFMQIFQPLEPEDFGLVKNIAPKIKQEAVSFCSRFSSQKKAACRRESWPLSREQILTPNGLVKFCSYTNDLSEQKICYNAMFYIITAQVNFDQDKIKKFCGDLPQNHKGQCFANSASRMIETDYRLAPNSVQLCAEASKFNVQNDCYKELLFYSTFNFHSGSEEFLKLCNAMPEPWKGKCLNHDKVIIKN